jgi:hypothetical protein
MRSAEFVDDSGRSAEGQALRHGNDALGMHGGTLRSKEDESVRIAVGDEFSTPFS